MRVRTLFLASIGAVASINNGLGKTPGMGWNSDYCEHCEAGPLGGFQNEAYIRSIALFLKSSGLAALGYTNVNMDASWDTPTRDADGNLQPDAKLWPSGIAKTIDFVHSLGLGFGLYGDRGTLDCARNPGNLGHEVADANFYASLKIDWFKTDSCYASADHATAFAEYGAMRDALNKTGRPIWLALCGWNTCYAPVGASLGNSWRVGVDTGGGWSAVMSNVESMLGLASYAGPTKGWNDMSLLLLPGMGSGANLMSHERHRSQFALHCIFAANMLLTGNLSSLDPYALQTWGNPEAVAINQDYPYLPFVVLTPDAPPPSLPSSSYTPARVAECGGEPSAQAWQLNDPRSSFIFNPASQQCLNVDACGAEIIYDGCTTSGSTCAGVNKFSNEEWNLTPTGALISALPGARCATVAADSTVSLATCATPLPASQKWTYVNATGELLTGAGLCLTVSSAPPPSELSTLLVGRPMSDGSWALLALNNQATNDTIVCGDACFAAMDFPKGTALVVRDVWLHAAVTPATAGTPYPIAVGPDGASVLLRLSKAA